MIKAVVFDLDNTLVDFMRMKRLACDEAVSAMIGAGLELNHKKAMNVLFALYDQVGIEDKQIFQRFLKKAHGKVDWKILAAGIVAYRRIKEGYLVPYPRVESTLIKLKEKGIALAILSDAPRMRAWTRLASMRLMDFFDIVVTHDDTKAFKPDPKTFSTVLKKLKLPAEEVMMVGDWPDRDMIGANKAGMITCFARYGCVKPPGRVKVHCTIDSISDIVKCVDKL